MRRAVALVLAVLLAACATPAPRTPAMARVPVLLDVERVRFVELPADLTAPVADPAPWAITWRDAREGWEARGIALTQCNFKLARAAEVQGREADP